LHKAALNAVTAILAAELREKVAVNSVCPGWVKTDMGGPGAAREVGQGADTAVWLALEAPYLLPVPALLIVANVVNGFVSRTGWPFVAAALITACVGLGFYASRRGKFVVWAKLLDELKLKGHERILDMGCGRGAVLLLAAQHLTTGRAVGVDLWRKGDQSGNAAEATLRNAEAEGVADRVELRTADMTALPLEDNTFDMVLSNVAIHNAKGRSGRAKAIEQAVRVLRPGGRLMIADILATRHDRKHLAALGMAETAYRSLGWRLWWSGPWLATCRVSTIKPSNSLERARA
jgi:arsenite methyltransferase